MRLRTPLALTLSTLTACEPLLHGRWPIASLTVGTGRGFSIQADLACEVTCGISYRTWDPAHGATQAHLLGFTTARPRDLEWSLLASPDHRWAAVAEREHPYVVLALHDFGTGFDWPSCPGIGPEDCARRAGQGLAALQEPGGERLVLATQVPGNAGLAVAP
jgi:hypothetical protein